MNSYFSKLIHRIKQLAGSREIVFWGYDPKVISLFDNNKAHVSKIFTGNQELLKSPDFQHFENLRQNKDKYFVFLPLRILLQQSISTLEKFGYREQIDFCSLYPVPKIIKGPREIYSDNHGNYLCGIPTGMDVSLSGYNNELKLGANCSINGKFICSLATSGNTVNIGNNADIRGNSHISALVGEGGALVSIGNNVRFTSLSIETSSNSQCDIKNHATFAANCVLFLNSFTRLIIGEDCMFSYDVVCHPADGHSIFNIHSGKNINSSKKKLQNGYIKSIILEDHVWVGYRSFLIGDTHIGKGSVIGAQSTVKGIFSNNVVIAGNPGKVRKQDIAWAREFCADDISSCKGYIDHTVDK